jgi:hypothetical protein
MDIPPKIGHSKNTHFMTLVWHMYHLVNKTRKFVVYKNLEGALDFVELWLFLCAFIKHLEKFPNIFGGQLIFMNI